MIDIYVLYSIGAVERHQNLLKWKELKRKQLEKEKKKRMPTFKTGIYQPSPPKFLVSEDVSSDYCVFEVVLR